MSVRRYPFSVMDTVDLAARLRVVDVDVAEPDEDGSVDVRIVSVEAMALAHSAETPYSMTSEPWLVEFYEEGRLMWATREQATPEDYRAAALLAQAKCVRLMDEALQLRAQVDYFVEQGKAS